MGADDSAVADSKASDPLVHDLARRLGYGSSAARHRGSLDTLRTPCQVDHEETGREWADDTPPKPRTEIQAMATKCSECPVIRECHQRAEYLERQKTGATGGVWGGLWRRDGMTIDPWGPEHGDMTSVGRYVWYDRERETWRAEKVVAGKRVYIITSDDEDVAVAAAYGWRVANDDV